MDIKQVYWFSHMSGMIGIVVGQDKVTGQRKGYIGAAPGFDEDEDTKIVAERGSPVNSKILTEIADYLNGK